MVGVSGEVGKGRGVWDVISFWTGREQEDGSSFLRRMSGVGMEEGAGGVGVSVARETNTKEKPRLVWKSEFRAVLLVDSLASNLRGGKYQAGRVRRWQLVRGGCPCFFLVCHLAHTHHESNAASFF